MKPYVLTAVALIILLVGLSIKGVISGTIAAWSCIAILVALCLGSYIRYRLK